MKKKVLALAMTAIMAASLGACGGTAPATESTEAQSEEAASVDAATTEVPANQTTEESQTGDETTAEAKGTLIMATNAEFPPYEFHDGGEIVGIDVEIARAIATEMGMDFEIEDIAFDSIIPAVQSGKADFGAAGMTVREDRKVNVDFSDPYAAATQVVIVKEDSDITGPADLEGKLIGVQQGTTGDIYSSEEFGDENVERYNKGFEAVQALTQNKIDAVIIDGEPAKVYVSQNQGLRILDEAYTEEEYAICVKKGNTELLESINAAIAKLKESGELQTIVDKYIAAE